MALVWALRPLFDTLLMRPLSSLHRLFLGLECRRAVLAVIVAAPWSMEDLARRVAVMNQSCLAIRHSDHFALPAETEAGNDDHLHQEKTDSADPYRPIPSTHMPTHLFAISFDQVCSSMMLPSVSVE